MQRHYENYEKCSTVCWERSPSKLAIFSSALRMSVVNCFRARKKVNQWAAVCKVSCIAEMRKLDKLTDW